VGAYNAVIAAVVGFTTQEYAPIPSEHTRRWQNDVRARLESVTSARYPILAANIGRLGNRAFVLRWQNGTEAPLDASFDVLIDILIAGLERLAESK
jgi:hypothetical protein